MSINYEEKYLKYKNKYLSSSLKYKMSGGAKIINEIIDHVNIIYKRIYANHEKIKSDLNLYPIYNIIRFIIDNILYTYLSQYRRESEINPSHSGLPLSCRGCNEQQQLMNYNKKQYWENNICCMSQILIALLYIYFSIYIISKKSTLTPEESYDLQLLNSVLLYFRNKTQKYPVNVQSTPLHTSQPSPPIPSTSHIINWSDYSIILPGFTANNFIYKILQKFFPKNINQYVQLNSNPISMKIHFNIIFDNLYLIMSQITHPQLKNYPM